VFAKVENKAKPSGIEKFQLCISKAVGTMGHYRELFLPHDNKFSRFCFTEAVC